jgi:hypothetical protein
MKKTIIDLFESSVEKYGKKTFLLEKRHHAFQPTTYAETREQALEVGAGLASLGIRPKDKVAILAEGSNGWIISELGIFYAGAISVPLSVKLEESNDLLFRLRHAEVKALFVSKQQLPKIRRIRAELPELEQIIVLGHIPLESGETAYGMLRSYPRYIKYWEQKERDKYLETQSQSAIVNKSGQYYQLIKEQQAVAEKKNYTDSIVGRTVADYIELKISGEGTYYDKESGKVEPNSKYGLITFVDLGPQVQLSSKNNIVLTTVQGRDYTRKEFISGGDLEFTINGRITSKYPDVYPEAELSKFLKIVQYKGVIDCDNTILRQLKISQLIILGYSLPTAEYRNVQPYTLQCVAVEPSEAVELISKDAEVVDEAIEHTNKWIKWVRFGTDVIDPTSILKLNNLWL